MKMPKSSSKKRLPIVLFDIDYTLFDVGYFDKYFHQYLSRILAEDEESIRKVSIDLILSLIEKDSFLNIDKYLKILLSKLDKEKYRGEIEDLLFNTSFFKGGFYEETERTLRSLKKIARLGIFSQGHKKFQGSKIEKSGFKELFDKELIYIVRPRKLNFLPLLKNKHKKDRLFLVEDKPFIVHTVKQNMPDLFTIWVKRGKYAQKKIMFENFNPDAIIKTLTGVIDIVKYSDQ